MEIQKQLQFADALVSDKPSEELGEAANVYAWLIGSWNVLAHDYEDDGSKKVTEGEWHFSWVLEGRAVQDVWIAPKRSLRIPATSKMNNRYGTSLRVYHVKNKVWNVHWHNPVNGTFNTLTVTKTGDEIVQEGIRTPGILIRWKFKEITATSFRWVGERSSDEGKNWITEAEFFGKKIR